MANPKLDGVATYKSNPKLKGVTIILDTQWLDMKECVEPKSNKVLDAQWLDAKECVQPESNKV